MSSKSKSKPKRSALITLVLFLTAIRHNFNCPSPGRFCRGPGCDQGGPGGTAGPLRKEHLSDMQPGELKLHSCLLTLLPLLHLLPPHPLTPCLAGQAPEAARHGRVPAVCLRPQRGRPRLLAGWLTATVPKVADRQSSSSGIILVILVVLKIHHDYPHPDHLPGLTAVLLLSFLEPTTETSSTPGEPGFISE